MGLSTTSFPLFFFFVRTIIIIIQRKWGDLGDTRGGGPKLSHRPLVNCPDFQKCAWKNSFLRFFFLSKTNPHSPSPSPLNTKCIGTTLIFTWDLPSHPPPFFKCTQTHFSFFFFFFHLAKRKWGKKKKRKKKKRAKEQTVLVVEQETERAVSKFFADSLTFRSNFVLFFQRPIWISMSIRVWRRFHWLHFVLQSYSCLVPVGAVRWTSEDAGWNRCACSRWFKTHTHTHKNNKKTQRITTFCVLL